MSQKGENPVFPYHETFGRQEPVIPDVQGQLVRPGPAVQILVATLLMLTHVET